jgi:hypothetical protein
MHFLSLRVKAWLFSWENVRLSLDFVALWGNQILGRFFFERFLISLILLKCKADFLSLHRFLWFALLWHSMGSTFNITLDRVLLSSSLLSILKKLVNDCHKFVLFLLIIRPLKISSEHLIVMSFGGLQGELVAHVRLRLPMSIWVLPWMAYQLGLVSRF